MSTMSLEHFDSDNWKTDSAKIFAHRNTVNRRGVKYGDKILEQYDDSDSFNPSDWDKEHNNYSMTRIGREYLKKLFRVMKMTEAESVDLYVGEDAPVLAELQNRDATQVVIAPRIEES